MTIYSGRVYMAGWHSILLKVILKLNAIRLSAERLSIGIRLTFIPSSFGSNEVAVQTAWEAVPAKMVCLRFALYQNTPISREKYHQKLTGTSEASLLHVQRPPMM